MSDIQRIFFDDIESDDTIKILIEKMKDVKYSTMSLNSDI